jgi:hypothetical protein
LNEAATLLGGVAAWPLAAVLAPGRNGEKWLI